MSETQTIHCFEAAGLGKAPFTYEGMVDQDISYGQRNIGTIGGVQISTKPGGTCDYCSTYIVNMFRIRSADGKTFKVGCDCLMKTGDAGLIQRVKKDVSEMERKKRAQKKIDKEAVAKAQCEALLSVPAVCGVLAEQPHPSAYFANEGKTKLDWAKYMLENRYYTTLLATLKGIDKR